MAERAPRTGEESGVLVDEEQQQRRHRQRQPRSGAAPVALRDRDVDPQLLGAFGPLVALGNVYFLCACVHGGRGRVLAVVGSDVFLCSHTTRAKAMIPVATITSVVVDGDSVSIASSGGGGGGAAAVPLLSIALPFPATSALTLVHVLLAHEAAAWATGQGQRHPTTTTTTSSSPLRSSAGAGAAAALSLSIIDRRDGDAAEMQARPPPPLPLPLPLPPAPPPPLAVQQHRSGDASAGAVAPAVGRRVPGRDGAETGLAVPTTGELLPADEASDVNAAAVRVFSPSTTLSSTTSSSSSPAGTSEERLPAAGAAEATPQEADGSHPPPSHAPPPAEEVGHPKASSPPQRGHRQATPPTAPPQQGDTAADVDAEVPPSPSPPKSILKKRTRSSQDAEERPAAASPLSSLPSPGGDDEDETASSAPSPPQIPPFFPPSRSASPAPSSRLSVGAAATTTADDDDGNAAPDSDDGADAATLPPSPPLSPAVPPSEAPAAEEKAADAAAASAVRFSVAGLFDRHRETVDAAKDVNETSRLSAVFRQRRSGGAAAAAPVPAQDDAAGAALETWTAVSSSASQVSGGGGGGGGGDSDPLSPLSASFHSLSSPAFRRHRKAQADGPRLTAASLGASAATAGAASFGAAGGRGGGGGGELGSMAGLGRSFLGLDYATGLPYINYTDPHAYVEDVRAVVRAVAGGSGADGSPAALHYAGVVYHSTGGYASNEAKARCLLVTRGCVYLTRLQDPINVVRYVRVCDVVRVATPVGKKDWVAIVTADGCAEGSLLLRMPTAASRGGSVCSGDAASDAAGGSAVPVARSNAEIEHLIAVLCAAHTGEKTSEGAVLRVCHQVPRLLDDVVIARTHRRSSAPPPPFPTLPPALVAARRRIAALRDRAPAAAVAADAVGEAEWAVLRGVAAFVECEAPPRRLLRVLREGLEALPAQARRAVAGLTAVGTPMVSHVFLAGPASVVLLTFHSVYVFEGRTAAAPEAAEAAATAAAPVSASRGNVSEIVFLEAAHTALLKSHAYKTTVVRFDGSDAEELQAFLDALRGYWPDVPFHSVAGTAAGAAAAVAAEYDHNAKRTVAPVVPLTVYCYGSQAEAWGRGLRRGRSKRAAAEPDSAGKEDGAGDSAEEEDVEELEGTHSCYNVCVQHRGANPLGLSYCEGTRSVALIDVAVGSPAYYAGVRAGCVVLAMNGVTVRTSEDFKGVLRSAERSGEPYVRFDCVNTLPATVARDGTHLSHLAAPVQTAQTEAKIARPPVTDASDLPEAIRAKFTLALQRANSRTYFVGVVRKHGAKYLQDRVLSISERALYAVDPEGGTVRRVVKIAGIHEILTAPRGYIGLRIPSEYDLLFQATKGSDGRGRGEAKTKYRQAERIVELLLELFLAETGFRLRVTHCEGRPLRTMLTLKKPEWVAKSASTRPKRSMLSI